MINEELARRAKENMSFSDYKPGSATAEYNAEIERVREKIEAAKAKVSPEAQERLDRLMERFAVKYANWTNARNRNGANHVSWMISGPANYNMRAHEKYLNRERKIWEEYEQFKNIEWKIQSIINGDKVIRSDDKNAVEKIKAKIAALEVAPPDRWGYNKTEIRRLKERLLQLAPDEVKAGKEITINGEPATYDNIIKIFDSYKPECSRYSPEENRFYLSIPFIISDGTRNYKCFVSCETNENGTEISTYGNADNGYKTIWKPLDDERKFNLMIGQMSGSGNKSVIYSILKDLAPAKEAKPEALETDSDTADTVTINGEVAKVVRNKEDMRLQLIFDGKPEDKTRETLKSNGFRWAPSNMAWQRLLNENAERALRRIVKV